MAQRFSVRIKPLGGTSAKADPADPSLWSQQQDGSWLSMDVYDPVDATNGYNWDNVTVPGQLRRIMGYANMTSYVTSDYSCQEYFTLDDGENRNRIAIIGGVVHALPTTLAVGSIYETSAVHPGTTSTFSTVFQKTGLVSAIQYGAYAVISDLTTTPYKWRHGDAYLSKLIQVGHEYKFKYLEQFHQRIIGAHSDQDNGNIDIRWTEALPSMTTLSFPASNQIYKPDNDIGITGIKRMGDMACLVYGRQSIHILDYQPDYAIPFSLYAQVSGTGTDSHWSIIDTGNAHYFFDRDKGFVAYAGGRDYLVISDAVEPLLDTIDQSSYGIIYGKPIPYSPEIVWAVPLNRSSYPNALLYYNTATKQWRRSNIPTTAFLFDQIHSRYTFSQLGTAYGKWSSATGQFSSYQTTSNRMLFAVPGGAAVGKVYFRYMDGDNFNGSAFSAWRIEPIMFQPDATKTKRIQEIHFIGPTSGNFNIDVYWRTGQSEQAVNAASWTGIGSASQLSTGSQVLYMDQSGRFHQFKWGTDGADEGFKVSEIIIKGIAF